MKHLPQRRYEKALSLDLGWLQGLVSLTHVWVRVFGYGFILKDTKHAFLLFSERNGRGRRFGRLYVRVLRPEKGQRHANASATRER